MSDNINNTLGIDAKSSDSNLSDQLPIANNHFKTLLSYGKFISGLGWALVIIGGLIMLTSFS